MNEREIFEEKLCHKLTGVFNTFTNQYEELIDQLMWEAWQTSANRQGYKLIPVEPTDAQVKKAEYLYINECIGIFDAVIGSV